MIYQYRCAQGCPPFDVIKSHVDMEREEACPRCTTVAVREFVPSRVHFIGTKVTHPEFNPGLGCVVNDKAHKRDILKARGLEEVGSEPVEKIHKHYDERRSEKLEQAYEDATKGWVGDGSS